MEAQQEIEEANLHGEEEERKIRTAQLEIEVSLTTAVFACTFGYIISPIKTGNMSSRGCPAGNWSNHEIAVVFHANLFTSPLQLKQATEKGTKAQQERLMFLQYLMPLP